jgi:hypothetical protein
MLSAPLILISLLFGSFQIIGKEYVPHVHPYAFAPRIRQIQPVTGYFSRRGAELAEREFKRIFIIIRSAKSVSKYLLDADCTDFTDGEIRDIPRERDFAKKGHKRRF